MEHKIRIVDYEPKYQPAFETLNRAWIEKYFTIEPIDEYLLQHPEQAILEKGGAILIALYEEDVAGVVALLKESSSCYEFAKMTVAERFRRKGIAEALSLAAFDKARELGADRIVLYSQQSLQPAIRLYEKIGFRHVPVDNHHTYKRADVKMELNLADVPVTDHS